MRDILTKVLPEKGLVLHHVGRSSEGGSAICHLDAQDVRHTPGQSQAHDTLRPSCQD